MRNLLIRSFLYLRPEELRIPVDEEISGSGG